MDKRVASHDDSAPITRNERRVLPGAVRCIRTLQGLTQDQVATRAGEDAHGRPALSHTTVSHIEAGRRQPSLEVMCQLATGLGVDLDDITYMTVVEPKPARRGRPAKAQAAA